MIKIKICGLKRESDALLAQNLGATFLGVVAVPSSPHFLPPEDAKALFSTIEDASWVLVVQNTDEEFIKPYFEGSVKPSYIQFHVEHSYQCIETAQKLKVPYIQKIDFPEDIIEATQAFACLLDSKKGGDFGSLADWNLLNRAQYFSELFSKGLFLAEGIFENKLQVVIQFLGARGGFFGLIFFHRRHSWNQK